MGIEDFNGDMDFKVAGTEKGITALQLDVKTLNLNQRNFGKSSWNKQKMPETKIMKVITDTIDEPRKAVSQFAPKIKVVKIPVDKIGEFIGPGGKNIKKLMADTGVQVDVNDDGSVSISGVDEEKMNKAVAYVEGFAKEVVAGEIYDGEVVRIMPFGAFVNILPGKDGMVHVSDMGKEEFVQDANDVVKIGDKIKVRVVRIDEMGRINLSMNMDPAKDKPREERPRSGGGLEAVETVADEEDLVEDRGGFEEAQDAADLVGIDVVVDLEASGGLRWRRADLIETIVVEVVDPISQLQDWLMTVKKASTDNLNKI